MAVTFDLTWDSPEAEEVFKKAKKIKLSERYFYIAEKSIKGRIGRRTPNVFTLKQIDDIANLMKTGTSQLELVDTLKINFSTLKAISEAYGIKTNKTVLYARNDFGKQCLYAAEHLYDIGKIDTNTDEKTIRQLVAIEVSEDVEDVELKLRKIKEMTAGNKSRYTDIVKEYAELKNKELSENDRRVLDVLNGNLDAIAATDEDDSEERVYYGQADEHKYFNPELGLEDTKEDEENIEEDEEPVSQPVSSPTRNVGAVRDLLEGLLKDRGNDIQISRMVKIAKAYEQPELYEACDELDKAIYRAATADFVGIYNELTSATAKLMSLVNKESIKTEENTRL